MTGGELDVTEGHPGVEGGHDEGGAEHVRVDVAEPGPPSDRADPAMGGSPVQALARGTEEDRPLRPLAHGQIDHPSGSRNDGDDRRFRFFAHDPKGPVPTVEAQVLDVGTAGLAHPQSVEAEQDGERSMGVVEVLRGEEEPAELGAVEAPAFGTLDGRTADVLGRVGGDTPVDVGEAVEAAHGGQAPIDRRRRQSPGLQCRAEQLNVRAGGAEHLETHVSRPLEERSQVVAIGLERSSRVARQECRSCDFGLVGRVRTGKLDCEADRLGGGHDMPPLSLGDQANFGGSTLSSGRRSETPPLGQDG